MKTAREFVAEIIDGNQALFEASKSNVKAYFESNPNQADQVEHFIGRMVNERMNMAEISYAIANAPADTPAEELELLTKQAQDEARHFRMVKEVIEHIKGEPIDVDAAIAAEAAKPTAKGADLLEKYGAKEDEAALAAYQLVAEGRAEAVWDQMAESIEDTYISSRYAKIARDEGFHATLGARKLEQLATSPVVQERVMDIVNKMRKDLYDVSCKNTTASEDGAKLIADAYGW